MKGRQAVALFTLVTRVETVFTDEDELAEEEVVVPAAEVLAELVVDAVAVPAVLALVLVLVFVLVLVVAVPLVVPVAGAVGELAPVAPLELSLLEAESLRAMVPLAVPVLATWASPEAPSSDPLAPHADKTKQHATTDTPRPRKKDINRPEEKLRCAGILYRQTNVHNVLKQRLRVCRYESRPVKHNRAAATHSSDFRWSYRCSSPKRDADHCLRSDECMTRGRKIRRKREARRADLNFRTEIVAITAPRK